MAVVKSRDCGRSVSTSAKRCPKCGSSDPSMPLSYFVLVAMCGIGFVLCGLWLLGVFNH